MTTTEHSYLLRTALSSYLLLLLELHVTKLFSTWLVREKEAPSDGGGGGGVQPARINPSLRSLKTPEPGSSPPSTPNLNMSAGRKERERKHESENSCKKRERRGPVDGSPGRPKQASLCSLHTLRFILLSLKWRLCDYCTSLYESVRVCRCLSQALTCGHRK